MAETKTKQKKRNRAKSGKESDTVEEATGANGEQADDLAEAEDDTSATPERDTAWETAEKPDLSPEEWLQDLPPEKLRKMARDMLLARRFEEKVDEVYSIGKIGGFCHLYIGQEAVVVGGLHAQREDDYMLTAYREHAHALQVGIDPDVVMAELYGKEAGMSRGKGGSMHMYGRDHNYLGGHGIVGGGIPIGLGVGWAIKYRGEDRVVQTYFGEAAVNQGAFHESMNMAALWELPCVFIVENNRYGMGTAWERAASEQNVAKKGEAYAMASAVADGMDVLDMYRVTKQAVDRAREESKPTLIEARTYRYKGHSMSDPSTGVYRTKEDVEREQEKDSVFAFADLLAEAGILSPEDFEALDDEVKSIAEAAAEFADEQPDPRPEALYEDVYTNEEVNGRLYFDMRDDF